MIVRPTRDTTNRIALPAPAIWNLEPAACGLADFAKPQAAKSLRDHRLPREFADVLRDAHRAKLRAAHRAELRRLEDLLRQRLVVHRLGGLRVERQLELLLPVERETR